MIKKFDTKCGFVDLSKLRPPSVSATSMGDRTYVEMHKGNEPFQAPQTFDNNEVYVLKENGFYEIYVFDNWAENAKDYFSGISYGNLASKLKKVLNKKALNKTGIVVNGVLTISEDTYQIGNCEYLCNDVITRVEIPSTCDVKDGAFMGCPNLEEVVFYDVKHEKNKKISIYPYAFFNCEKLEKIVLPKTLKSIGKNAFGHCPIIKDVTSNSNYPITFSSCDDPDECAFGGLDVSQCSLHVPASSIIIYKDKNFWKDFGNITAIK